MVDVADIKKDLPNWPDDVIDQWLFYFANEPDCGWPPPEPLGDHRWKGILGGRPLSWWRDVTWNKETVKCDVASLSKKSQAIVSGVISEVNAGKADAVTKRRFDHSFHFILNNAAFPKPILAMKVSSGLEVVDGSHRMSAYHYKNLVSEAEKAVASVSDPALKQIAFQKVLDDLLSTSREAENNTPAARSKNRKSSKPASKAAKAKSGPTAYIQELIDDNFFKKPKLVSHVQE
jgi:hypothetical protein